MISAVIVNYNSGLYLLECVESLMYYLDVGDGADEIIIIDNNSSDDSLARIEPRPGISIVRSQVNLGYGGGCNMGFERSGGEIIFFMNSDVKLVTPAERIRAIFELDDGRAIIAPGIIEQGYLCNSVQPFPSVINDMLREFGLLQDHRHEINSKSTKVKEQGYFSGYARGPAFFVSREAFRRVSGFDPGFFLFYEEADLFKRMQDLGLKFFYEPECMLEHAIGVSSTGLGWKKTAIRYNSKLRYFSKHTSKPGLLLHRLSILIILFLKLLIYAPSLSVRHRRLIPERINAYLYGIKLYARHHVPWSRVS